MNSLITLAKQRGYLTEVAVCCVADRRRWICQRNELTAREIPAGAGTAAEWGDTPPRYDPKTGKRVNKNVLGKTQVEVREKLKTAMAECQGLDVSREADEHTLATWLKMWYELYAKPNVRLNHFYPFGVWVKMRSKHLTHTKNQILQQKILKNRSFRGFLELLGGFEPPTSSLPSVSVNCSVLQIEPHFAYIVLFCTSIKRTYRTKRSMGNMVSSTPISREISGFGCYPK